MHSRIYTIFKIVERLFACIPFFSVTRLFSRGIFHLYECLCAVAVQLPLLAIVVVVVVVQMYSRLDAKVLNKTTGNNKYCNAIRCSKLKMFKLSEIGLEIAQQTQNTRARTHTPIHIYNLSK